MVCQLLDELNFGCRKQSLDKVNEPTKTQLTVCSDSRNLESTIPKDTAAVHDKRLKFVLCMLRELFVEANGNFAVDTDKAYARRPAHKIRCWFS